MKVLSVASEVFPLIKTGGLADVAGALPLALARHGVVTRTLLPGYPQVMDKIGKAASLASFKSLLGVKADIRAATYDGLDLYVLDAPELYARDGGPYGDKSGADYPDNWRRFAAFSKAAAEIAHGAADGFAADIIHAHDWQAGLALAYLRYDKRVPPPSIMTVHNLAFQGQFPSAIFGELELPAHAMAVDGVEYYGGVGYLKGGLQAATVITTVSPTYAQEIRTPEFGMGLDGLINLRAHDLHGIVNGIDTDIWNPETDKHLAATYTAATLDKRAANRAALQERMGLAPDDAPIFCVVSRLTWQKGMDVLCDGVDDLVARGGRLAVLGSGDKAMEGALLAAAARHRGKVAIVTGYDEPLSHLMQGGADAILIPSRFEPCGLTQLYGLRYGCIPVVTHTGGLADTIIDANTAATGAGVATGIQFSPLNKATLSHAIGRTIALHRDRKAWRAMQQQGMRADVSWDVSAARYAELYTSLRAGKAAS